MEFKRTFRLPDSDDRISGDVDRELELHLELRAREFEAQGMSPSDARRAALDAFGDRDAIEREVRNIRAATAREQRRRDWLGELRQDIVVGLRGLRRAPGFTLVALLTLAIGIGANTAIFSVLRSVILRPLPYTNSQELVQVWSDHRAFGRETPEWLSPPQFEDWRTQNRTFVDITSYSGWAPDITSDGDPASLSGMIVSGNFFEVLGGEAVLGRTLTMADDDPGVELVVVLSHAFWHSRFGDDSSVIDRQLMLSGTSARVVGVLSPAFRAPIQTSAPDVYRAARRPAEGGCQRGCIVLRAIGRLKPGVSLAAAQEDLAGISMRLREVDPRVEREGTPWLIPLHEQITGPVRLPLLALSGAVAMVLLIGCVNLANLLLVRGAAREREVAVRAALGASRARIARQLLTENTLLTVAGGVAGILLGIVGSRLLATYVPASVQQIQQIRVDGNVLLFAGAVTVAAGIAFGLIPALRASRTNLNTSLRDGRTTTGSRAVLGSSLVVTQIALAVVLLIGAGLMLRSFVEMQQVDLGYRTSGIALAPIAFPAARYPDRAVATAATANLLSKLREHPAVRSAELADIPPMSTGDQDVSAIPLGSNVDPNSLTSVWYRSVTPGYMSLMQMRVIAGRLLEPGDRQGSAPVGVVNAELANRYWPGEDPVGRVLQVGGGPNPPRLTIVGVVESARRDGPDQPFKNELFIPYEQIPTRAFTLVLEPAQGISALNSALREALREVDPLVPAPAVQPLEERVGNAVALPRLYATLASLFAGGALLLAALGVYGVMGYTVAMRRREIGVRLALGADPSGIRRLVLGRGGRLTVIGLVIGLGLAVALGRVIDSLLFGVTAFDLATWATVPLVLGAMSLLASWVPARRAMRVDPVTAMREE